MKWTENKEYGRWDSNVTPIGRYQIVEQFSGYSVHWNLEQIAETKTLDKAKDEAEVHINTLFYKLKLFLEL